MLDTWESPIIQVVIKTFINGSGFSRAFVHIIDERILSHAAVLNKRPRMSFVLLSSHRLLNALPEIPNTFEDKIIIRMWIRLCVIASNLRAFDNSGENDVNKNSLGTVTALRTVSFDVKLLPSICLM